MLRQRDGLRQQIISEIEERREWLKQMRTMNEPDAMEAQQRVRQEISARLKEIVALNAHDSAR